MVRAASARIVIAERWTILRRGIIGTLQGRYTVVDGFDDVSQLAPLLDDGQVDVAIIGSQPSFDIAAIVAHLRDLQPALHVMVLCEHMDVHKLRAVLQAGAGAVLSKKLGDDALLDAIARVLDGERVIDQSFLDLVLGMDDLGSTSTGATASPLTGREQEVLLELARGATNREIADMLLVSESTVKSHLRRIYSKLEVGSRHGAVGRALELELLA